MGIQQLEKAFDLIQNDFKEEEKESWGPVSEQTILNAENALKTKFPLSYKVFLQKYGCDGIRGLEVYGLIKDEEFDKNKLPNGSSNVVWYTLIEHRDFNHPLSIPIIYNLGDGTEYGLDTSQMNEDGECPVVAWHGAVEEGDELEVIAPDFGTWFLEMVEEKLKNKKEEQS